MNALVTGSEGFVARHLIPKLKARGYSIYGTEDLAGFLSTRWENDRALIPVPKFDAVIHLAANIVNVDERARMGIRAYDDISLDLQMCRYLENNPPRIFVAMSSCAVDYPSDPYCIVKRTFEAMVETLRKRGQQVALLRPFSGYGPDQSLEYPFPAIFARAMAGQNPLTVWTSLSTIRDWIHIDDLTDAIIMGVDETFAQANGQPIEIGTGIGTSFGRLAEMIAAEVGYFPVVRAQIDKIGSSGFRVAKTRRAEHFGFKAKISLVEGIRRAAEYYHSLAREQSTIQHT